MIVDVAHRQNMLFEDVVVELKSKFIFGFLFVRFELLEVILLYLVDNINKLLASDLVEQKMALSSQYHQLFYPLVGHHNRIPHIDLDVFEFIQLLLVILADCCGKHQLPFHIIPKYLHFVFEENAAYHPLLRSLLHDNLFWRLLLPAVRISICAFF